MKPLSVCVAALLPWGLIESRAQEPADELFHEPFADKLQPGWTWTREEPGSWRIDNGALIMRTPQGYLYKTQNNARNLLLRPAPEIPAEGIAVEVDLESAPLIQYEHAGLIWYYDDDNYACVLVEVLKGKTEVQMVTEKDAQCTFAVKEAEAHRVRLRLEVANGQLTTAFRAPTETTWTPVATHPLPKSGPAQFGLTAGGAPKDAGRFLIFRDLRAIRLASRVDGKK